MGTQRRRLGVTRASPGGGAAWKCVRSFPHPVQSVRPTTARNQSSYPLTASPLLGRSLVAPVRGSIFSMKFRTLSEAKAQLGALVRLAEKGETVVISRHGRPAVRLALVREEDFSLTTHEARKLEAWVRRERTAGRTREYPSMDALLRSTRPRKKSRA